MHATQHARRAALALALAAAAAASASPVAAQSDPRAFRDLNYDLDSPPAPAPAGQNFLDVYSPMYARRGSRPVVVYAHGGGWKIGDKANQITDKVNLLTGLGYVFVSVNYRLSPDDVTTLDPARIKHPDHAHDVGEALGWLDRNVGRLGGDPERMFLMGHSAGGHLVSLLGADPRYAAAYGVDRRQLLGVISLDTGAFDVTEQAGPAGGPVRRQLMWNAFGTPEENALSGSWRDASPLTWADPGDPPFLLVTQTPVRRRRDNQRMANALAQPDSVLSVPLSHEGINDAVGAPGDASGVTSAVTSFLARLVAQSEPPRARIAKHPRKVVTTSRRRAGVSFRFRSNRPEAKFRCRMRTAPYERCRSPRRYRLRPGRYRFSVRALSAGGRPGKADSFSLRVVRSGR